MCTGLPKSSLLDYAIHNHSNMQKIGCRISMISVLYYGDISSFRVLSRFSRSLYFLLLTGRVPSAAYWITFILVSTWNHDLETLALLSYFLGVYRNLIEHSHFPIFSH